MNFPTTPQGNECAMMAWNFEHWLNNRLSQTTAKGYYAAVRRVLVLASTQADGTRMPTWADIESLISGWDKIRLSKFGSAWSAFLRFLSKEYPHLTQQFTPPEPAPEPESEPEPEPVSPEPEPEPEADDGTRTCKCREVRKAREEWKADPTHALAGNLHRISYCGQPRVGPRRQFPSDFRVRVVPDEVCEALAFFILTGGVPAKSLYGLTFRDVYESVGSVTMCGETINGEAAVAHLKVLKDWSADGLDQVKPSTFVIANTRGGHEPMEVHRIGGCVGVARRRMRRRTDSEKAAACLAELVTLADFIDREAFTAAVDAIVTVRPDLIG